VFSVGPSPAESAIGLIEKMPHRDNIQVRPYTGASDDPSTPATLIVILSLLPQIAAPFLSRAWAKCAAFSLLA
jgi:hypothetical protein